ncbi:MAG: hypothetical protein ACT4NX_06365 [Deltaproteobacteria bacterium]
MNGEELKRLREGLILPAIQSIARILDEIGWRCAVGNLKPLGAEGSERASEVVSLSVMDIENRLVQHVYVSARAGGIYVLGDGNSKIGSLHIEPAEAEEKLDWAIRAVLDLGI